MSLLGKWINGVLHEENKGPDPLKTLDEKLYDVRTKFEAQVHHAAEKSKVPEAIEVARSVTGFVFDFGDMDFGMSTPRSHKAAVEAEIKRAFIVVDIPPDIITNAMIHRAWRAGRTGDRFIPHMLNLYRLALANLGRRAAPAGEGLFSVHAALYKEVCEVEIPDIEIAHFLANRQRAEDLRKELEATEQAEAEAKAAQEQDADSSADADAATAANPSTESNPPSESASNAPPVADSAAAPATP